MRRPTFVEAALMLGVAAFLLALALAPVAPAPAPPPPTGTTIPGCP